MKMVAFARFAIRGLGLQTMVAASFVQNQSTLSPQGLTTAQAQRELGSLVSSTTAIFGPADPRWPNATERYQDYAPPRIQLVVQPGRESDVPTVVSQSGVKGGMSKVLVRGRLKRCQVQYANNKSVDFFVVNRGHALTSTVGEFTGIQIDVRSLRNIVVQPDRQAARLQAGTYNAEVIDTLWNHGYVAGMADSTVFVPSTI